MDKIKVKCPICGKEKVTSTVYFACCGSRFITDKYVVEKLFTEKRQKKEGENETENETALEKFLFE